MTGYTCMITEHRLSRMVLGSFAKGSEADFAPVGSEPTGIPVYYGILRKCGEAIKRDLAEGKPFVYVDHGYFARSRHEIGDYSGHYRIVKNGLFPRIPYDRPITDLGESRWWDADLSIAKWLDRPIGCHVLVSPPSPPVAEFHGIDRQKWVDGLIERGEVSLPIVVTDKAKRNFWPNILSSRLFVSHSSQGALEALRLGIPAACTSERSPLPPDLNGSIGAGDSDRLSLFCWLAERQFTLSEMESGEMMEYLEGKT